MRNERINASFFCIFDVFIRSKSRFSVYPYFGIHILSPLLFLGEICLGAVIVLSKEDGAKMDGSDMNLARLTADILAHQLESTRLKPGLSFQPWLFL